MRHERAIPAPQTGAQAPEVADIAQELDEGGKLAWFCAKVGGDVTKAGLIDIVLEHARTTPRFPSSADRVRDKQAADQFFKYLAILAGGVPDWGGLRDKLAERIAAVANGTYVPEAAPKAAPPAPNAAPAPPPARAAVRTPDPEPEPEPPSIWREQAAALSADGEAETRAPQAAASPFPLCLAPPPPETAPKSAQINWLSGRVWHPLTVGLLVEEEAIDFEDLTDLERDMTGAPARFFERPDVRPRQNPEAAGFEAGWLSGRPAAGRGPDIPARAGSRALAAAMTEALGQLSPAGAVTLKRFGGRFQPGPGAAAIAAAALEIEAALLQDAATGTGEPANLQSMPSDAARVTPGWVLRRAAFAHLAVGEPLARCLGDALIELRMHQAEVAFGWKALIRPSDCEKNVYKDMLTPLEAYRNEPEASPEP